MDPDWDMPRDLDELFSDLPKSYHIIDRNLPGDNIYGMQLFIDNVPGLFEFIIENDGTQVVAKRNGISIVIDSTGLGDFHMHGFDVSLMDNTNVED